MSPFSLTHSGTALERAGVGGEVGATAAAAPVSAQRKNCLSMLYRAQRAQGTDWLTVPPRELARQNSMNRRHTVRARPDWRACVGRNCAEVRGRWNLIFHEDIDSIKARVPTPYLQYRPSDGQRLAMQGLDSIRNRQIELAPKSAHYMLPPPQFGRALRRISLRDFCSSFFSELKWIWKGKILIKV